MITILLMSISTIGIGILPSEQQSFFTLIILALLRMLQGFSAGGEYSGAGLIIVNHSALQVQSL